MNTIDMTLSELQNQWIREDLSKYEVLHIVSSSRYGRSVLLENKNLTTERVQLKKIRALLKKISWKLKVRWSCVETHTGVFGNQVANSLAKKESKDGINQFEADWWNSEVQRKTISQSLADEIHENQNIEIYQKNKNPPSYYRCNAEVMNYFVSNAKNSREQERTLVNTIYEGYTYGNLLTREKRRAGSEEG